MGKERVCISTWHTSLNYGTCIQAYALAEYLKQNECDVFVPNSYRYYYGVKHPFETIFRFRQKSVFNRVIKSLSADIKEQYDIRYRKNVEFAERLTGVISFSSKKEFDRLIDTIDVFVSGSDQIWNPSYVTPPMMLSFAGDGKRKIAYGSSIGVSRIPANMVGFYRKYLADFERIGVREKTAQNILSGLVDKSKIKVVIDPSFLLSKRDWEGVSNKPNGIIEKDEFIFCYFVGENMQWTKDLDSIIRTTSMKVICMPSEAMIIPEGLNCIIDGGVQEFIWCLLHAKFILTDSFHAIALAINFDKNFIAYKRFSETDTESQNSRVLDILNQFKLEHCLKRSGSGLELNDRDCTHSRRILEALRNESIDFLLKGIKRC